MSFLRRIHQALGGRWMFVIGFVLFCGAFEYGRVLNLRPLPMHVWRQTDCLSLTTNYYNGNASFASPRIHAQIADEGASGMSAGEFPLWYWSIAQVWKIAGPSEFVYRLLSLLLHFLASYVLFLTLRRLLRSDFWAIGVSLLLFTSPVLVYYGIAFLPDVPAFDLALIGWYFIVRHAQEQRRRWWVLALACFALATLLKVTAGMSLVALLALFFLVTIRQHWAGELRSAFPAVGFGWTTVVLALVPIVWWYMHAEAYNALHNGRYTFNSLWPIWEMSGEEVDRALIFAREILVFQVFDTSVWIMVATAIVVLSIHVRQVPLLLVLLNGLLLIGLALYTLFWFHAVDGHDYYFINPMITLLIPLVTWLWWLKGHHPDIFNGTWVRWAFLFLLGYNVAYASNNLTMRSNPYSDIDRRDLLPTYHCQEPILWNALAYNGQRDFHDITPTLRSLGIGPEDKVISLDDPTINASLYFMGQPGFTRYGYNMEEAATFERCIELGAKYMVFTDDRWLIAEHLQPYLAAPLGRHRSVWIHDLRSRDRRVETEVVFRQTDGVASVLQYRSSGTPCADHDAWCFEGNAYPFEVDELSLRAPGMLSAEVIVRGVIHWSDGYTGGSNLIMSEDDEEKQINYMPRELKEGAFEFSYRIPPRRPGVRNKLFLWNAEEVPFRLEGLEIEVLKYFPIK